MAALRNVEGGQDLAAMQEDGFWADVAVEYLLLVAKACRVA